MPGWACCATGPDVPRQGILDLRPLLVRLFFVLLILAGMFVPIWREPWYKETGWGRSSTQDRACGDLKVQHERQFPHRIVKLVKTDEHPPKKDGWGKVTYDYKCWFEDSITISSYVQGYL